MATPGAFHPSTALQTLTLLSVLALLLVTGRVQGRHHRHDCPSFSCGRLRNVSSPFRRPGDPPGCGSQSHELLCSYSKATIRIHDAKYYVERIDDEKYFPGDYSSTFWVVDGDLDLYNNSCPLPRWSRPPSEYSSRHSIEVEFEPAGNLWASFVNCSQQVKNNGMYMPVACLSTNSSFVYVLTGGDPYHMEYLEPSCGYLAMTPLGDANLSYKYLANLSYADVAKSMRNGFSVLFPFSLEESSRWKWNTIKKCLAGYYGAIVDWYTRFFRQKPTSWIVMDWIVEILVIDLNFWACVTYFLTKPGMLMTCFYKGMRRLTKLGKPMTYKDFHDGVFITIPYGMWIMKWIGVLRRFVLAPLAVLTFLAYKYWQTRITIDAVEKFLRMQQMHSPTRYAYTDLIAITGHFREKLGQGGYGSVYKGVLLPGDVHVAVKMLGNSKCNGEEFISEVATVGRIHHVHVVRLMGFCSEEMRRALVYEYMPGGSLDKYIFSSERSFSWDKLNEIALGIARGINYLHRGCDMQILHFDIKPHNILLDSNFVPKVADFGLAKLYPRDKSFVPASALRGTVGYIAPEMISRSFGVISSKSDVYSFGMLLLEMAGGRRNADQNATNSSQAYYPSWVYDRLTEQQEVGEISVAAADMHELERKLCIVGLCCIQMKSHDRPTMSEVIEMLEAGVDGLQVPSRPFFCDDEHMLAVESCHFSSELAVISEEDD